MSGEIHPDGEPDDQALPSLLLLRCWSGDEFVSAAHPYYRVFMAAVQRAGADARAKLPFERAPDGEELIFEDEVVERVRVGGRVESRTVCCQRCRVGDELPVVAERYRAFVEAGRWRP